MTKWFATNQMIKLIIISPEQYRKSTMENWHKLYTNITANKSNLVLPYHHQHLNMQLPQTVSD